MRLASKLINWDIDIKIEEEKRRELEEQMTALTSPGTPLVQLQGVGPKTVEKIEAHGISSIEKLADMTPEQLMEIPGIGEKMVEKIYQAVHNFFEGGEGAAAPTEAPAEGAAAPEEPAAGPSSAVEAAAPEAPAESSDAAPAPSESPADAEQHGETTEDSQKES